MCVCIGVGGLAVNFLMLSPEMLKSQIPISWVGGWWGGGLQSTFDTESRNAKVQNSHFWGGWVGGCGGNGGQLLMLSPEMLKSQILTSGMGVGGMLAANF